ncbi:MAG: 5-(carboxyamino)imidazole ribonucleotide mutase [Candidatus Taylorbacteria bacterium]|nr:5-(carboxyamino)imidazole ribonucleotide mutase [Candidatus Taylorbacteria bacterium]
MEKPLIGIIMGSDSDLAVMHEAAKIIEEFGVEFEITIVSAHRTPDRLVEYAKGAEKRGLKVIIAGAGGAAHLPGMTASMTVLPVIGVPVKGKNLEGMDSLLSIVQMPGGIPVATVAINGAKNAGLLALRILGTSNKTLQEKLALYAKKMESDVKEKAEKLEKNGYVNYLGL